MDQDMSKGKPLPLLLVFTLPILIGNIFQQIYSFVDTFVVGRYVGVSALAAVGSTGGIGFLVLGGVIGLSAGFSVIVSQKYGDKDIPGLKKAVAMSYIASLWLTVATTLVSVLTARALLSLLRTPEEIIDDAALYITVTFWGIGATILYNLLSSFLRAVGDSKSPLIFLIIASVLNVGIDLLFVLVFRLGVLGVALATILSQAISALLCALFIKLRYPILTLSKTDWQLDFRMIGHLLAIGIPSALQFSVCAVGVLIVQTVINDMGTESIAAFSMGSKIVQIFVMQPVLALGVSMAIFSGQNLGAGRLDRVRQGVVSGIWIAMCCSAIAMLLLFVFPDQLAAIFIDPAETVVIAKTRQFLFAILPFIPFLGLILVLRNTCQGLGSGMIPLTSSILELGARTSVALTLPKTFGFIGICYSDGISWFAASMLLIWFYRHQMRRLKRRFAGPYGDQQPR